LNRLYPGKQAEFAKLLQRQTAAAPGDERQASKRLGERAAAAALERGQRLDEAPAEPYRRLVEPGVYIGGEVPSLILDFDPRLVPWVLDTAAETRIPPPPPLTSAAYARDLNEVRALGTHNDEARSEEQSETAKFWFLIDLNPVLREIAAEPERTLADNARLYAMFYMATDDGWFAAAVAKTRYQFWRPVTAIRNADRDDNPGTARDPYWLPYLASPAHPEYPCAHCVQAAAQAEVLKAETADPAHRFAIRSSTLPGADPRVVTLADYVTQTSLSRVYAGAHYGFSNRAGEQLGRRLGRRVLERWARAK
ncbi:MAG: vanadium-dependent haloperoxidase, partial [Pseudomonadota bacterium]